MPGKVWLWDSKKREWEQICLEMERSGILTVITSYTVPELVDCVIIIYMFSVIVDFTSHGDYWVMIFFRPTFFMVMK